MSSPHKIDELCSCQNCTKIDCLIGDPLLNQWERTFIGSLSRYGWIADYTDKQVAKLKQIWRKILRIRKIK